MKGTEQEWEPRRGEVLKSVPLCCHSESYPPSVDKKDYFRSQLLNPAHAHPPPSQSAVRSHAEGLGNCVVRDTLNHMIGRSEVFQMGQEAGLALFVKAHQWCQSLEAGGSQLRGHSQVLKQLPPRLELQECWQASPRTAGSGRRRRGGAVSAPQQPQARPCPRSHGPSPESSVARSQRAAGLAGC